MVSVGEIIYRIQENPLMSNVQFSDVVRWVKDFINLVGTGIMYEDKVVKLDIIDFRAQLPKDFRSETACRLIMDNADRLTLGFNTDQAYKTYPSVTEEGKHTVDLLYTHKIVGEFIYTDFETGAVELLYKAYIVDEKGWPKINADVEFINALEWYIKKKYYTVLYELSKISQQVYQNTLQQYQFAVAQAKTSMEIPDPIEAEALANALFRLVPLRENVESGHKYDSQKERIYEKKYYRR